MSAAPSIVQVVPNASAGSTIPITGTAGNLYVLIAWNFAANGAASDSAGNVWTKLQDIGDVNGNRATIYVAPITHGGSTTVAAVDAGARMSCWEVSGWSGNVSDIAGWQVAVPSTAGPFTVGGPQLRVLANSLGVIATENQQAVAILDAGFDSTSGTLQDDLSGLDKSVSWSFTQSAAPLLSTPYISSNAAFDDMAFVGIVIPNADAPGVLNLGGGDADDRYRFRNSQFVSHTSTLGTMRAGWPDDARDITESYDSFNDNASRLN